MRPRQGAVLQARLLVQALVEAVGRRGAGRLEPEAEVEAAPAAAPEAFALEAFVGRAAARRRSSASRSAARRSLPPAINNGSTPELVQVVRGPLDHGIVVGGELRDPEALAVALRDFFKRHNLPKRGIRLGIANNRIGVRTFDVIGIDDPKQLANAIRFRAQEVLPIPIEDAVLDYQVLSEGGQRRKASPSSRVLLVVAYRELVDRYVRACEKAGLQIVGIDLEAFALLRAVSRTSRSTAGLRAGRRRRGLGRSRPLDLRGLRRTHLRVHARARVGRLVAERRDCAGARHLAHGGRADQAGALLRRSDRCSGRLQPRSSSRPRSRLPGGSSRRLRGSSSPRSSSTRTSPARWVSARSSSPAARRI